MFPPNSVFNYPPSGTLRPSGFEHERNFSRVWQQVNTEKYDGTINCKKHQCLFDFFAITDRRKFANVHRL